MNTRQGNAPNARLIILGLVAAFFLCIVCVIAFAGVRFLSGATTPQTGSTESVGANTAALTLAYSPEKATLIKVADRRFQSQSPADTQRPGDGGDVDRTGA